MNAKYVVCDPADNYFGYFASIDDAKKHAREIIEECRDDSWGFGWPEGVDEIVIARVVMRATKTDIEDRPENLDEEECDEDGNSWEGISCKCNYEMQEVVVED
ncbi:hypothetical protein [Carnimonas bestiolae]|uniref:hypothetical protein n=1 Tax=Carnimonas bestiolae TaxID=3402172 RepID=UPI003EDC9539